MKSSITKNILLSIGAATIMAGPIVGVFMLVPRGYEGRYDSKFDGKLKILHSFSETGNQIKALEDIVQEWNKKVQEDSSDLMPMEIARIPGGYPSISPTLSTQFEANDRSKLPNMIIGYPDSLGTISRYNMQVPLDDTNSVRSLFDESFVSINDQIAGIDVGGLYSLPIAKSIDMQAINKPVLTYLASMTGVTGVPTNDYSKEVGVQRIWGNVKEGSESALSKYSWEGITTRSKELLNFARDVKPLFPNSEKKAYVLGIDSATNFIYQTVFQSIGANLSNFLFSKDDNGYIKYNWDDPNSESRKVFNEIYSSLKEAIDVGSIYINAGGNFSSNMLVEHRIGIAYGSTAGYQYNFLQGDVPYLNQGGSQTNFTSYTDLLSIENNGDLLGQFGRFNTHIYFSTFTGQKGQFDILLENAEQDNAIKQLINKASLENKENLLFVSSASDVSKISDENKVQITNGSFPKYLILLDGVTPSTSTLQESELEIKNVPWKYENDSSSAQLVQGPSLIGVHINEQEDAQLSKFTNWFMKGEIDREGEKLKPYEIFAKTAGYIVPTKEVLEGSFSTQSNPAQTLTYQTLKDINDNASMFGFDNPVDYTTGEFRNTLQSVVSSQYTNQNAGSPTLDPSEIYEQIQWLLG